MINSRPVAIVTGGSRGLGRSTVLSLAKRGDRSIFTYHSHWTEAEKVVTLAREAGVEALALPLDTGKAGDFDGFVGQVREALGRVGEPQDIGPMIAALVSDDNRWINGQRIEVSGGMVL